MTTAVDAAPDTAGADLGAKLVAHIACVACYPVDFPGMLALCGAELLGIPGLHEDTCEPCDAIWNAHAFEEHPHP